MTETRDRTNRISVGVTPTERAQIKERAATASMSVSAYLLAAGLAHPIRSTFDHETVRELARLHGDLGRVGGLLKMALAGPGGPGASPQRVQALYDELAALRERLLEKIEALG